MVTKRRRCVHCDKLIPRQLRADARYCSDKHKKAAYRERLRKRKALEERGELGPLRLERPAAPHHENEFRSLADRLDQTDLFDSWRLGEVTLEDIQETTGTTYRQQVKRALDEVMERRMLRKSLENWERAAHTDSELGLDLDPPDANKVEECWAWAREMAQRFLAFEARWFKTPHPLTGKPESFIRKPFHVEWLEEILFAQATGGYLQVMSPPRHGKSQLLANLSVWWICRNPNIRIAWVSGKEPTAKKFVNAVARKLENPELVAAHLPPGQTYKPRKKGDGSTWQSGQFIVDCRMEGLVGDTMLAVGRGQDILSLNCDVIVCDDIENAKSTAQPGLREDTRHWFSVDLDSRKMDHTFLLVIGSRQRYEDLYGYNMDDPNFRFIVNSAHSAACRLDPEDAALHVDCMLFPELRTYRWLMTKKNGFASRDMADTFDMVYYNDPSQSGLSIFSKDAVRGSFNPQRQMGAYWSKQIRIPRNRRVAGLDPSSTGYQAATAFGGTPVTINVQEEDTSLPELTMYDVQDFRYVRHVLAFDNHLGGGIENWLILAERWRVDHEIYHWVVEDMGFQKGYRDDPRVKAWARKHGIYIEGHGTYGNKYDPMYGVGAMARYFPDLYDIPYGDAESRALADMFLKQCMSFVDNPGQKKNKSDILMSAWFPQKVIRRWEKELLAEKSNEVDPIDSEYAMSYPDLDGFTDWNSAPWSE